MLFIYVREQFRNGNNFSFDSCQNNCVYLKPGNQKTANHVWRFGGKQLKNFLNRFLKGSSSYSFIESIGFYMEPEKLGCSSPT